MNDAIKSTALDDFEDALATARRTYNEAIVAIEKAHRKAVDIAWLTYADALAVEEGAKRRLKDGIYTDW